MLKAVFCSRNITKTVINKYKSSQPLTWNRFCSQNVPISKKIEAMVKEKDVVVFMKGVPDAPQCGFSNAVVQILQFHGLKPDQNSEQANAAYSAHNVLADEELREGIKNK